MVDKRGFMLFNDYNIHIQKLSDEDAGKLFKTILNYVNNEVYAEPDGALGMAWSFIKEQLDRDAEKYEARMNRCKQNGTKGGRPKNDSRFEEFYKTYPRKVGKVAAEKAWDRLKLTSEMEEKIINDVKDRYKGTEPQFIPYPATYLNQHRWDDERLKIVDKKHPFNREITEEQFEGQFLDLG